MTCTRCGLHEGTPRREHAERVLCDQCAQRQPVVDYLNPPPYTPPADNGNGHLPPHRTHDDASQVREVVNEAFWSPEVHTPRTTTERWHPLAGEGVNVSTGWGVDTLTPPKLRVLDVEQMLATEPPPVPWVVEPLLAEGCVTMLAGREGQGKSMLGMALASAIGHGATIAGLGCSPGRTLIVDAENGEREAHRRVRGLGVKPGTLVYVEAVGFNLAHDVELLHDLVDDHDPTVVVLDSLRSLAPGLDENDSRPVEAALRPVSRLAQDKGLPVLLLHHAGKQGVEYRGSTAIGAAVEIGFTLSRHEDDPDKRTRRRLACWKSRPAPEPEARWISLESRDGMVLLGEAEPYDGPGRPRDQLRDEVLAVLTGIAQSQARIARTVGRDPKDQTVRRVLKDLEDDGLAHKRPDGWVGIESQGSVSGVVEMHGGVTGEIA